MIEAIVLATLWLMPGHFWTNSWDNGQSRTLHVFDRDPWEKPAFIQMNGDGSAYIDGKGVMSLTGNAPRYRVLEQFLNVNITLYAKRVSEIKQIDSAGFVIAARSHHYTDQICGADTLYAQLTYDGRVSIEKELFHGVGRDAFYPNVRDSQIQRYAFPDGVPFSKWIGIRFVVTSVNNNNATLMQMYLDKQDDGKWQQVLEYTDKGDWEVNPGHGARNCDTPKNKILTEPGFVFIRNDGLGEAQYKDFTIKEIAP